MCYVRRYVRHYPGPRSVRPETPTQQTDPRAEFDKLAFRHVISSFSFHAPPNRRGGPMKHPILTFLALILMLAGLAAAQDLASFERRVTVKQLANGLTVLI